MSRRYVGGLVVGLLVGGLSCRREPAASAPASAPAVAAPAPVALAPASAPAVVAPAPPTPAAVPSPAKPPTESTAVSPVAPTVAVSGASDGSGDWLVWFQAEGQWKTHWLQITGGVVTILGEQQSPFLSDGTRIWQVVRRDTPVSVEPCAEADAPEGGRPRGTITWPGLAVVELGAGKETRVIPTEPLESKLEGFDVTAGVDVLGGAGARLITLDSQSGYFCGAHGVEDQRCGVFDAAKGEFMTAPGAQGDEPVLRIMGQSLPKAVRDDAAAALAPKVRECDGDAATIGVVASAMWLDRAQVFTDVAGQLRVRWTFAADAPYACSSTYSVTAEITTGLLAEAAPVGLDAPPPAPILEMFAAEGAMAVVGWAKLSIEGGPRDAALAAFQGAPSTRWPAATAEEVVVPAAHTGDGAPAPHPAPGGQP